MDTKMTVKDVLKDVMDTLNNISIPMSQLDDIGMPIARAINGIKACVDAMEKAEAEEAMKNAAEETPAEEEGSVSE